MTSFPTQFGVAGLLTKLLRRRVEVKHAGPVDLNGPGTVGLYRGEHDEIVLCYFDIVAANSAGAALAVIPAAIAEEGVNAGIVEDFLLDNLAEVLNIGSQWFEGEETGRVRLIEVAVLPGEISERAEEILGEPKERVDFDVQIPGYGSGKIAFLI